MLGRGENLPSRNCSDCQRIIKSSDEHPLCYWCRETNRMEQLVGVEPTSYHPGTIGKMAVMRKRKTAGLPIFHPADARR
jgi:hypothetical protein